MLVSSIYEQVKEVTGKCDEVINFQALSRAVELLSNEGLFDPLIGYLDFTTGNTDMVALPRQVKTVLRVNINNEPTFFRNRLFEFTLNTNGSAGGNLGFEWSDRGYTSTNKQIVTPGLLSYKCIDEADIGKKLTAVGINASGLEVQDTVVATMSGFSETFGSELFVSINHVSREATKESCLLYAGTSGNSSNLIAQYHGDEEIPSYRWIKLSQKAAAVRIMFRREVFDITSQSDIIPLNSKMGVIHACKAVRYYADDEYEKGDAALARAVTFLKKEQASRDEQDAMAAALEIPSTTNTNINVRDSIVVGDIYDAASEIFGNIGRTKLFDKITQAIEVLRNKAHWDSGLGVVDLYPPNRTEAINVLDGKGTGYYVLPRFVESVVSLNDCGSPSIPRNQWFEFHMNGTGQTNSASYNTWDDAGETSIIQRIPIREDKEEYNRRPIPTKFQAICEDPLDVGKEVVIYGVEIKNDREVEVWRNGVRGWVCPCNTDLVTAIDETAPAFVSVERIKRASTTGFVRLYSTGLELVPEVPEVLPDVTSIEGLRSLGGNLGNASLHLDTPLPWTGPDDPVTVYGLVAMQSTTPPGRRYIIWIYSDDLLTDLLYTVTVDQPTTQDVATISFTVGALSFLGDIRGFASLPQNASRFEIVRVISTPAPAVPAYYINTIGDLYGYWYPDEVEPKYRAINTCQTRNIRIRVLYRKRWTKVTSLYEPIPLRSRLAIENMMRSLKIMASDPVAAQSFETLAVGYLTDERINSTPSDQGSLQFDHRTMPGVRGNIT